MKKIILILFILTTLASKTQVLNVNAMEGAAYSERESRASNYFQTCRVTMNSPSKGKIKVAVVLNALKTKSSQIDGEIQVFENGNWSTIDYISGSKKGGYLTASETYSVDSKKTYRAKVVFKVYTNDGGTEEKTVSNTVVAK